MLPYELIGKVTVGILVVILILAVLAGLILLALVAWNRFWRAITNLMWRGYSVPNDPPTGLRRDIAYVSSAFSRFKWPSDLHENIRELYGRE